MVPVQHQIEPAARRRSGAVVFATMFVIAAAIAIADSASGTRIFHDNDDRIRALQIRELLDGGYFDLTYPFVSMPETYVSHYSRIVDLPYYLITKALSPMVGTDLAFQAAVLGWPLVLLAAFVWFMLVTMGRLYGPDLHGSHLRIATVATIAAVLDFSPGRIDHHNVQHVLMAAMTAGLIGQTRVSGFLAGAVAAISVAVGLECLPYIIAGFCGLALAAVLQPECHGKTLSGAGLGLALAIAPAGFASLGADGVLGTHCDAIGLPWASVMGSAGGVLAVAPLLWTQMISPGISRSRAMARFASLAIPALFIGTGFVVIFPECMGGPYTAVSPLVRELWLDRILQEKGLLTIIAAEDLRAVLGMILYGAIAVFAGLYAILRARSGKLDALIVVACALASLAMYFAIYRSIRFLGVFIPLFVPAIFDLVAQTKDRGRWFACILVVVPMAIPALVYLTIAVAPPALPVKRLDLDLLSLGCEDADLSVLDDVAAGRILSGERLSIRIAEEHRQHTVSALPLHRAWPGLERLLIAVTTTDGKARAEALAPFDYFAVCAPEKVQAYFERLPLLNGLLSGKPVNGLSEVSAGRQSPFRLYAIDRERL